MSLHARPVPSMVSASGRPATGPADTHGLALCSTLCDSPHMPTNLDIDPGLLAQAVKVSGERTKTAAVTRALREYVARHEQRRIVELFAALDWDPRYDHKAERTR